MKALVGAFNQPWMYNFIAALNRTLPQYELHLPPVLLTSWRCTWCTWSRVWGRPPAWRGARPGPASGWGWGAARAPPAAGGRTSAGARGSGTPSVVTGQSAGSQLWPNCGAGLCVCVVSNWSFRWLTSGVFRNFEIFTQTLNQLGLLSMRLLNGHNNQYLPDFPQNLVIFRFRPDWRPEKLPADRLECIASQTETSGKYPILRYASKPAINKWINLINYIYNYMYAVRKTCTDNIEDFVLQGVP